MSRRRSNSAVRRGQLEGDGQREPWQTRARESAERTGLEAAALLGLGVVTATTLVPEVGALAMLAGAGAVVKAGSPRTRPQHRQKWLGVAGASAAAGLPRALIELGPSVASNPRLGAAIGAAVAAPTVALARWLIWPPSEEIVVERQIRSVWASMVARIGTPDARLERVVIRRPWLWLHARWPQFSALGGVAHLASEWMHTGAKEVHIVQQEHDPTAVHIGLRLGDEAPVAAGQWPGMLHSPLELSECQVGVGVKGAAVTVPLLGERIVMLGVPGRGKTTTLRTMIAHAMLSASTEVWGSNIGGDLARLSAGWARCADTLEETAALLEEVEAEVRRRVAWISAHRLERIEPTERVPAIVVVLDEIAQLVRTDRDAQRRLGTISALCRKAAVSMVMTSQRPTTDWLPSDATQIASVLVTFAMRRRDMTAAWGHACDWTADAELGVGEAWVGLQGHDPVRASMHQLSEADQDWCAARSAALRTTGPSTSWSEAPTSATSAPNIGATSAPTSAARSAPTSALLDHPGWANVPGAKRNGKGVWASLAEQGDATVADLAGAFDVSKDAMANTLKALAGVGLARRDESSVPHKWRAETADAARILDGLGAGAVPMMDAAEAFEAVA